MQTFIDNLYSFCTFFIDVLGDIATFFISNPLGLLVIGLSLFSVILAVITKIFDVFHK